MTQILAFVPVLHAGYERFLAEHCGPDDELLLVGRSFAADHAVVRKEIRALDPDRLLSWLLTLGLVRRGRVVEAGDLPGAVTGPLLKAPDEELIRALVAEHGLVERARIELIPTFLRWDKAWSRAGSMPDWDGQVSADEYARSMQALAAEAAGRSSDWWRQVGAAAVRDGEVLAVEHNRHLPDEYAPYLNGDPRNDFKRGVEMDRTTAIHAEAALVARAAREGIALQGADLHVTTFPCPGCARLVAEARFARCFFGGGYSVLEGDAVLQRAGVELIYVEPGPAGS
ncbi:deaminase [Kineosporia rhizophila]|uniref:deoxycytidylate deaminase n=1 Tax=Kineosporia rhizophila TaxID=84633 RepID=UPI001E4D4DB0|nr:deaminase [Kineosporia rhizophila]MCE0537241.1 deaminase [Kineosporia rhizophila]